MDDLLREFLTETAESLDVVDLELVRFEQNPKDGQALDRIFRLVHTIKGTCGFLGLPRLESIAHSGETVLGRFRDGALDVTPQAVSLILRSIDRIKEILLDLEQNEVEPDGNDEDLISQLDACAEGKPFGDGSGSNAAAAAPAEKPQEEPAEDPGEDPAATNAEETSDAAAPEPSADAEPSLSETEKQLGRKLKVGEVSLDELERAFQEAEGPSDFSAAVAADVDTPPPAEAKPAAAASAPKATEPNDGAKATNSQLANQSIRVNVDVLEELMTMVSELVLTRNQLLQMVRGQENNEFKVPLQRLSNVTADLQDSVMKTRMQPIGNAWQKLPRIVRDLAQELGKKIDLQMIGQDTELDRQVLELIKDPLTHMVRNSADHGLEGPDERRGSSKDETGTITLRAYHEGGHIIIEIGDDGRGLNIDKIKQKALKNGITTEAELEKMTEAQIQKFIFAPGFSTAAAVTNVSGRGVGMDVVRTNIELIGGTIDLRSIEGKGSIFTIKIPLTLAIVSALIVETGDQRFAVPQISVLELVRTKAGSDHRIEHIEKTPVLRLRDRLLPLVDLSEVLGIEKDLESEKANREEAFVIVTQVGAQTFGIVVDGVFDTEEIVVKPVANILRDVSVFSGNTILGDGSVIMIIDPNGIASQVSQRTIEGRDASSEVKKTSAIENDKTSILIFRAGTEEPKAVPLSLVTRLEEVEADRIEQSDGRLLVQYRGRLMPVIHVDPMGSIAESGRQPILVFADGERSMGLAVDQIIDITEEKLDIEIASDRPGLLGSAQIKGAATEIIDVGYFITQVYEDWFERIDQSSLTPISRKLLLVDDSPFFLNMLSPLLSASGYEVTAVPSADEALQLRETGERFDVIVSDIEMPGTDGFDFAKSVKGDEVWAETPIIALTARTEPEFVEKGRQAGFDDYVAKADRDGLLSIIGQTISNQGAVA